MSVKLVLLLTVLGLSSGQHIIEAEVYTDYELDKPLDVGDLITAWGVYSDHTTSKFSLNIKGANGMFLLHVDFRPWGDVLVLNSLLPGVGWQAEVRPAFPKSNLEFGQLFSVSVEVMGGSYTISFNGDQVGTFPQRQSLHLASHVVLHGGSNGFQWKAIDIPPRFAAAGVPFRTSTGEKNYLDRSLGPGSAITAWGIYATGSSKFNVNLMTDDGVFMVHIDFRPPPSENKVVLNSNDGYGWETEIRTPLPTFEHGKPFRVDVLCLWDAFYITVDGIALSRTFPYREGYALNAVKYVWLLGGSNGMVWTNLVLPYSYIID